MKNHFPVITLATLITLLVWSCRSNPTQPGVIEMVKAHGKEIPKIHLEQVDDSAATIKLTDLFEDFKVIPLETRKECMIAYPGKICLTGHSILTWTQVGIGPCRVLEFNLDGKYLREYGTGGKGPGEHGGYLVDGMAWYPELKQIFISFAGMGPENHLFMEDSKFLRPIINPVDLTQGVMRFNDTTWMTPGEMAGTTEFRRDSIRLIMYSADGREIKVWPRTIYPPEGQTGYSPGCWNISLYQHQDQWRMYSPGDDTLYKVGIDRLDPLAIFILGPKGQAYNQFIDPSRLIGTYMIKVVRETEGQWFFEKSTIKLADLHQYGGNHWGGMFDMNEFLIVIDKKSGKARNLRFEDDLLGIPHKPINRSMIQWTDKGEPFLALIAVELKESIKTALKKENLDPKIRSRLEQLDSQVTEDSNPVIVLMKTREDS
jgi:hypothetical protein